MLLSQNTTVGTLQVRGAANDDPALRLVVSSQLGGADFRPTGMPPSAILIVRSLADPLPGSVSIRGGTARRCADWERAVKVRLGELYRCAIRPQHGIAVGDANAVVFTDEAELLACLALDIIRGYLRQSWWWRLFLKSLPTSSGISNSISQLLSDKVIYLPAVLDLLAIWDRADAVIQVLSPEDSLNVLSAMVQAYQLKEIASGLSQTEKPLSVAVADKIKPLGRQEPGSRESELEESRALTEYEFNLRLEHHHDATKPWREWLGISTVPKSLSREKACLLGLGLMLHRMPSFARSLDFQRLVIGWWNKSDTRTTEKTVAPTASSDASVAVCEIKGILPRSKSPEKPADLPYPSKQKSYLDEAPETSLDSAQVKSAPESKEDSHAEVLQTNLPQQPIAKDGQVGSRPLNREASDVVHTIKEIRPEQEDLASSGTQCIELLDADLEFDDEKDAEPTANAEIVGQNSSDQATKSLTTNISDVHDVLTEPEDFVSTRLGGVLYLINLMIKLDLPHCFEKDWRLASRLGAWGLLEVLGRALLEDSTGDFGEDPLWAALAGLDGRQRGEIPGSRFTGHEAYRIPDSWFQQIKKGRETFRWAALRRRLRLWPSAGYLMLDIPRDGKAPHHQAQLELKNYLGDEAKFLLARSPFSKAPKDCPAYLKIVGFNEALLQWLAFTLPYLRYRLHLAFETDSGWDSSIARQIFSCPGKLYVTSTHVDFVTDINNISMPVRRAGLDRDPGWHPVLGRVVQFHFI